MILQLVMSGIFVAALIVGCRHNSSRVRDVGLVDTNLAHTDVVYEEDGQVYLKKCKPPIPPPLTRECVSDAPLRQMNLIEYLNGLPIDPGPYQRDEAGLALVKKAIEDAEKAVARGNERAAATVKRLVPLKNNLERILRIREELSVQRKDITYYDYDDEFSELLLPFEFSAPTSAGGGGPFGMEFVQIPKGSFTMGPDDRKIYPNNPKSFSVNLSYDFFMQTTELTQDQWYKVMGTNPSFHSGEQHCPDEFRLTSDGKGICPNHPVESVSWDDASVFIDRLNSRQKMYRYRFPTEAEWEYAARAGTTGEYSFTGDITDYAWFKENSNGRTQRVGLKKKNPFGLYDMHGNVWEWVQDSDREYPSGMVTDPVPPAFGNQKINRGGGFGEGNLKYLRSNNRYGDVRSRWLSNTGFRLVRVPNRER